MKKGILGIGLCVSMFVVASCGGQAKQSNKTNHEHLEQEVDRSGKEYISAYICPMHCKDSGSDTTGQCPVCEMDYVKNESK